MDIWKQIYQLNREQVIELLETVGISYCADNSTQAIKEALIQKTRSLRYSNSYGKLNSSMENSKL